LRNRNTANGRPKPQAEGDVVVDLQVGVEGVALEDHGDVAIARRHVVDHPVPDTNDAGRDVLEAGDHPERRGLAAARRPDEDHELTVFHGECMESTATVASA